MLFEIVWKNLKQFQAFYLIALNFTKFYLSIKF